MLNVAAEAVIYDILRLLRRIQKEGENGVSFFQNGCTSNL